MSYKNPVMIIDLDKCNGCYNCQIICKDENCGNHWMPYGKPQSLTGHFWLKIEEMERGTVPKVKVTYIPKLCMHSEEAPCIKASSNGAVYKRKDGIIIIDPEKSKGQKNLAKACPYNRIYWNDGECIPQKCTFCAHLLDEGWKEPRCVEACPTGAMIFGEYDEHKDIINKAEILSPEYGTKPRVYYLNLPKPFIAGALVEADTDECLEGAKITVTDVETGKRYQASSDNYGDFWFTNLEWRHYYRVDIEKEGYEKENVENIYTDKDINLGDILIHRLKRTL
jgi:Fe-S-cluster-containing dehydrogenase component